MTDSEREAIDARIGASIRRRRVQLEMTMAELGRAVGVSVQQIHKYETAQSSISAARAVLVARVLHVTLNDLVPDAEEEDGSESQADGGRGD